MRSRSLAQLFQHPLRLIAPSADPWPPQPEDLRIEGEKVMLRWPRPSDSEAVFAYASDASVTQFMDWNSHKGLEESRRFLYSVDRHRAVGREVAFGIIERATEDLIGMASLIKQKSQRVAELGYVSRRESWGRGYMTEAVRLLCAWAMPTLGLQEIFAEVHPENLASQRVLEKSGFVGDSSLVTRSIKGKPTPHIHFTFRGGPP